MYLQYLRAMGWGYSIMAFVVYFIQNVAFIGQNLWLSDWTNDATRYNNTAYPSSVRDTRVGVFGALGVAQGMSLVCFSFRCFALLTISSLLYFMERGSSDFSSWNHLLDFPIVF